MSLKTLSLAAVAAISFALPAFADSVIAIKDPYARAATKASKSGAAFMVIHNEGSEDDRLIAVTSDVAQRSELHTHKEDANGVMRMREVKEGFAVPAGGSHALGRGGDHVMFLGLTRGLSHGDVVEITLTFEKAGDITFEMPVDLERKATHGHGDHAHHDH